uniref:Uncharacterized protein n=1 Tax=Pseudomonas phage PACT201 TaxID=3230130 RepID=A0AAU8GT03_9VIRU
MTESPDPRRSRGQPQSVPGQPDDIAGYSGEVVSAMKVLEPLLRSGLLALHPDEWQGGKLSFLRPAQS